MSPGSARKPYPSDVSDEEWSLVAPYLTLMSEEAPQRDYKLRELFNALRYVIRYGIAWRAMPNDFPPWSAVYQQAQRWLTSGCFEALAQDLRAVLRLAAGRKEEPTAAIIDSRTQRSTPEQLGYRGSGLHRPSRGGGCRSGRDHTTGREAPGSQTRICSWATRCRRLVKDYERYAETLAGFHVIAFVGYMLKHAALLLKSA